MSATLAFLLRENFHHDALNSVLGCVFLEVKHQLCSKDTRTLTKRFFFLNKKKEKKKKTDGKHGGGWWSYYN